MTVQSLLADGFPALLATAAGQEVTEPWPRVHAFNVLRVAFGESSLTNAAIAYFSRGVCQPLPARSSQQEFSMSLATGESEWWSRSVF